MRHGAAMGTLSVTPVYPTPTRRPNANDVTAAKRAAAGRKGGLTPKRWKISPEEMSEKMRANVMKRWQK